MCRGRLGQARPVEQVTEEQLMLEATGQAEAETLRAGEIPSEQQA